MAAVGEPGECACRLPFSIWLSPCRSMSSPLDMCLLNVRRCCSLHGRRNLTEHKCPSRWTCAA